MCFECKVYGLELLPILIGISESIGTGPTIGHIIGNWSICFLSMEGELSFGIVSVH